MNPIGLLIAAGGIFGIVGAVMDWDWFMNHSKARFMCSLCGRNGARVFYIVLGLALVAGGVLMAVGIIHDAK